ncbi:MAG TPA: acetate/propionate family kinase [Candidatus Angelobacter sp.]|nr:acetate/propionate family kinase [Candidatus Angelobacter sp.]
MASESLTLVVNPGSASRKYALFKNGQEQASINFEFEDTKVVGKVEFAGEKHSINYEDSNLNTVSRYILPLLREHKIMGDSDVLSSIGIRVVAPSDSFTKDRLLTDEVVAELGVLQQKAPLHITTELSEIKNLKNIFPDTPIIAVSDSEFHSTKPIWACHYGIDTALAEKFGIKRYGYHGVSVSSVVQKLQEAGGLKPKTIVCHLGSGSSITAVLDGKSVDTTMGYSPLEGLVMASRSGNIDIAAALAIKRELQLDDDGLEQYLNEQSGLLGVSGSSNDIRQLLTSEEKGDEKAKLALDLFVYRVQQAIGQMAASLGGVDSLVFTATIGERSNIIRGRILEKLGYLGFEGDKDANEKTFEPSGITNIATASSKWILVVSTDEATEIARRAEQYSN